MITVPRGAPAMLAWFGTVAHLVVGIAMTRRTPGVWTYSPLPLLNLAVAICVLAYWAHEWYGYATRGVTWYASDQALPLYAAVVAIMSGLALAGRYEGRLSQLFQWCAFSVDAVALTGAALFLTFARFNRLF